MGALVVGKAPEGSRAVIGIAVDVLTGVFLMQLTTGRTAPKQRPPAAASLTRD